MSVTKNCIINSIQKTVGLSKYRAASTVETTIEIIKKTLESNEDVLITGFGKFSLNNNSKRRFSNPINGNAYIPDAKKVVTFKSSPILLKKLNDEK
jgi:integration host factor subunit alpha